MVVIFFYILGNFILIQNSHLLVRFLFYTILKNIAEALKWQSPFVMEQQSEVQSLIKLIVTGMKRRKKEIRHVSLVTFVAVLFLSGITLFQSTMNNYIFQKNLDTYGNWVVSSVGVQLNHPYLQVESSCTTGAELVDEQGESTYLAIGKAEDNFELVDGTNLYEGHMPEQDDEIVMDTMSLSKLGYSYDLGQTIVIRYLDAEETIKTREYKLVGTMKYFAQIWKTSGGYSLPNCFVTEEEFARYGGGNTTYFYQLNSAYQEINTADFANYFMKEGRTITYNSYVYENKLWGNTNIYRNVTIALMVMAALAISYLMIAYTGKRRSVYYKYRCIGATKSQVRSIIFLECVYATLLEIILGIGIPYGIAYVVCKVVSAAYGVTEFYEFDGALLVIQIFVAVGVVLLAVLATQCSIRDKRLAGNTGTVKPGKYKRLHRIALKTRKPEKTIFKRQNALRPVQYVVSLFFSIAVCGALIACAYQIYDSIYITQWVLDVKEDFTMEKMGEEYTFPVKGEIAEEEYGFINYDMYIGAEEGIVDKLKMCPGVDNISYVIRDGLHYFEWNGMEESQIMNELKENAKCDTPLEYGMELKCFPDLVRIKKQMKTWKDEQAISWDRFTEGEQVILIINGKDDTIQVGDKVNVKHVSTEAALSVEVGAIYDCSNAYGNEFMTNSYLMIGSQALAEKIAQNEGKNLKYNTLWIMYDQNASYESTDKQLAKLASDERLTFYSDAEQRRISTRQMMQDVGVYVTLFLMILVIYIVIQRSFLAGKNKYWQSRFTLLKQIGIEDKQYFRLAFTAECKTYLWIFAGLIPGYLAAGYMNFTKYGGLLSERKPAWSDMWDQILDGIIHDMNHELYIIIVLLLYLVMTVSSAGMIWKCIKGGREQ